MKEILIAILLGLAYPSTADDQGDLKTQALTILNTKCNVCHIKQNPQMIFTEMNMNDRARKIKLQVFTLRRMPKGNQIRLAEDEKNILRRWIEDIVNR